MKRIITCSDGTWDKPGNKHQGIAVATNVEKMFNSICPMGMDKKTGEQVKQLKVYDKGLGTGYSPRDQITGGITGAGIDKNIKDIYAFICLNYNIGDEIYLFGFSRGAYTARSLAGFIRNCGLLKPEHIHLMDKAYELYRDRNEYTHPESDLMTSWRANYGIEDDTPIKFIGVWDTVGSLGIPLPIYQKYNQNKYKFHDCTLSSHVLHAYHALAIDERRKLFMPTLWEKSGTTIRCKSHLQKMEQRWFAGVHANIGGGYADSRLSDIALKWMMDKAEDTGLCFHDPLTVDINAHYSGKITESYRLHYKFWLPIWRSIDLLNEKHNLTIDDTVWTRYHQTDLRYRPKNLHKISTNQLKN